MATVDHGGARRCTCASATGTDPVTVKRELSKAERRGWCGPAQMRGVLPAGRRRATRAPTRVVRARRSRIWQSTHPTDTAATITPAEVRGYSADSLSHVRMIVLFDRILSLLSRISVVCDTPTRPQARGRPPRI